MSFDYDILIKDTVLSTLFALAGISMSIKVRYFASLKESLGRAEDDFVHTGLLSVRELWQRVNAATPYPTIYWSLLIWTTLILIIWLKTVMKWLFFLLSQEVSYDYHYLH